MTSSAESLPKACVILGAGASHDVAGLGAFTPGPQWKPPLAKDLFNIKDNSSYEEILYRYPGAKFHAQSLAPLVESGQTGVENALRELAEHPVEQMRENFKQIPPYLRDLIYRCSNSHVSAPSSYAQLVARLVADSRHELLFISLNYDDLLEKALTLYDPTLSFAEASSYFSHSMPLKVLKLHGSIDWFVALNGTSWDIAVAQLSLSQIQRDLSLIVEKEVEASKDGRGRNQWRYPLVTAPIAGKVLENAVCPASHLDAAREFLADCRKFLIVGTSGLDGDLMVLLDSSVSPDVPPFVHVVDKGIGAGNTLSNFARGVRAFRHPDSPENRITFDDGFAVYVSGTGIRSFANFRFQA